MRSSIPPRPSIPPNRPYRRHPEALKQVYDVWSGAVDMTLCIGALALDASAPCIVLAFDYKIAGDEFGSESEYKFRVLSPQLVAMAADSVSRAKELSLLYRGYLEKTILNEVDVVNQLQEPVATFKRRLANSYIGRRLGLSYDEVWAKRDQWQDYLDVIEKHPLRVQMVIAGFLDRTPVLCELRDKEVEWRTNTSLIGSGAYTAEPALHARRHTPNTPLPQALYNVYEAKKAGEGSPFVGEMTRMFVLRPGRKDPQKIQIQFVTPQGENWLAGLYAEYGPKPMVQIPQLPKDALQVGRT
jgi:hypothetical protein